MTELSTRFISGLPSRESIRRRHTRMGMKRMIKIATAQSGRGRGARHQGQRKIKRVEKQTADNEGLGRDWTPPPRHTRPGLPAEGRRRPPTALPPRAMASAVEPTLFFSRRLPGVRPVRSDFFFRMGTDHDEVCGQCVVEAVECRGRPFAASHAYKLLIQ